MDRPVVWITIAYALGIICGKIIGIPFLLNFVFLTVFLLITLYAAVNKINSSFLILGAFFSLGAFLYSFNSLPSDGIIQSYVNKGYLSLVGCIDNDPKIKENCISFPVKAEQVIKDKQTVSVSGNIFVSLPKSDEVFNYGDKIKVRGVISEIQGNSNPFLPETNKAFIINARFYEKLPGGGGNVFKKLALWFSAEYNDVLLKILPPKEAALFGSILLGTSVSPLPEETKNNFRKAGLIHLLVVSGTQVSILIGVCLALTRVAGLPLWSGVIITSLFNLLLVIVTGAGASILRAAIMGEITLIGLIFERQKEFYTSLALSALILLVINPLSLFDLSFQLSFASTWAMVYIVPMLGKRMPALLAMTFAPLLATSPIVIFNFSQVTLGGIISNLLVLPWVEFLTIMGAATTVLGFIFLPLAQVLGKTIWLLLVALDFVVNKVSSMPGACFYIKAPSFVTILVYYSALMVTIEILRKEEKFVLTRKKIAFALMLLLTVFVWERAFSADVFSGKELIVTFIDVGQGDSILIETPEGKKVMIDGGGIDRREENKPSKNQNINISESENQNSGDPVGERVVVPFLHRKGINKLDLVVLTHPHADHLGGLNEVLDKVEVDQVLDGGQVYDSQAYGRFKELIAANHIKYSVARAGQVIGFDSGIKGYILNPSFPFLGDTNSDSIVMRLVYGDISFLFVGDLGKEGEDRILQVANIDIRSTILKVGIMAVPLQLPMNSSEM